MESYRFKPPEKPLETLETENEPKEKKSIIRKAGDGAYREATENEPGKKEKESTLRRVEREYRERTVEEKPEEKKK